MTKMRNLAFAPLIEKVRPGSTLLAEIGRRNPILASTFSWASGQVACAAARYVYLAAPLRYVCAPEISSTEWRASSAIAIMGPISELSKEAAFELVVQAALQGLPYIPTVLGEALHHIGASLTGWQRTDAIALLCEMAGGDHDTKRRAAMACKAFGLDALPVLERIAADDDALRESFILQDEVARACAEINRPEVAPILQAILEMSEPGSREYKTARSALEKIQSIGG